MATTTRDHVGLPGRATAAELVEATALGARIATRARLAMGQRPEEIRLAVTLRLRDQLGGEGRGPIGDETLMAAAQHALASLLGPPPGIARACPIPAADAKPR